MQINNWLKTFKITTFPFLQTVQKGSGVLPTCRSKDRCGFCSRTKASWTRRNSLKTKQYSYKEWLEPVLRNLCNILECIRNTSFIMHMQWAAVCVMVLKLATCSTKTQYWRSNPPLKNQLNMTFYFNFSFVTVFRYCVRLSDS